MYQKKRLSLAVTAALGLSSFLIVPSQALAQDQQSEDESEDLLVEEVIVTGSRILRDDGFGRTSPVTVVGMEDISSYGLTRIEDVLNNLPQIETSQNALISNGSSGVGEPPPRWPVPSPRKISTLLVDRTATARSTCPSRSKSPATAAEGVPPTAGAGENGGGGVASDPVPRMPSAR